MLERLRSWRGLARSLRVYRLDRQHLASLTAFYAELLSDDALVFDIGAHLGDRIAVARRLGARVVAVEPQPGPMRLLRLLHGRDEAVTLLQAAVGAAEGTARLHVNRANPTVSTLSSELADTAALAETWQGQRWDGAIDVPVTTLDALIAQHGRPDFIKIDVEGFEAEALSGLSAPVPLLSFEVTMVMRAAGIAALDRAAELGFQSFRLSLGESHAWHADWEDAAATRIQLQELPDSANSLDVYARP
ncbi:FkbM family methyltransferase [Pontivivens ytuae]|uniref:FkbM family methyltransferase n=1 Tax=Pontivivens ytuae TaxID=2789856 RepID=A0A7S9LTL1_9RHOB|nr:FkbM family methyltransferase [Pontivivens ytuae]QPH55002.1 FkbM family methyltransferase [Pontivivens ytuae]